MSQGGARSGADRGGRGLSPLPPALGAALLALLACVPAAAQRLVGPSSQILRHAERAGGGLLASAAFLLHDTVGDVGVRTYSGGGVQLQPGYIPLASQPGTITTITALSKSTGTLDLSWTAPGRDGFLGDVVNGFYRLDYSSDPAHVFAPTTYQLELSTTVVPGRRETFHLAGLQPNTTYYTKVYLADARKFFAEDSRRSDESTLANIPLNPSISVVTDTTVRIVWSLPAGGAAGFEADSSSTAFGGGAVPSSSTSNGQNLTLTVSGLDPNTTYFFKVASLNWQGQQNFTTLLATVTLASGLPLPVQNLAAAFDARKRTVSLTWSNQVFANPGGVLVLLSTTPFTNQVANGASYVPKQTLADAAVVKSTSYVSALGDGGLGLDTTYYYHLFSSNKSLAYSIDVSTAVFLDLPPMMPAALGSSASPDRRQFTLTWAPVTSSLDGTPFFSTASAQAFELMRYDILRATSLANPGWVTVATLPVTAGSYTDNVPDPAQTYIYKVDSVDSFGVRDTAMAVDTDHNLYVFTPDQVTHLKVPPALVPELAAGGNKFGGNVILRAGDDAPDVTQKVFRAAHFDAFRSPGNDAVGLFQFSRPDTSIALHYDVAGGQVVPSGVPAGAPHGPLTMPGQTVLASQAPDNLGMYWYNGEKYVKLFGRVDGTDQLVTVQSPMTGSYQIRSLLRAKGFEFDISQMSNKFITPNGDGLNDTVVFTFDNPKDSAFSGRIFDMRGASVADLTPGPAPNTLQWDARGNGVVVPGGVYIYQIRAEDKVFNGTVVVIR